ncbi:hypothetical protein [Streptomyces sp. NPDC005805]|uniref:hypothetical protein n=1 Tax=Streptomyces sp. NPDC005805 TaxID=3157068 RepID=UPI0033CE974F
MSGHVGEDETVPGPGAGGAGAPGDSPDSPDYSATALGSHWFEGPEPVRGQVPPPAPLPGAPPAGPDGTLVAPRPADASTARPTTGVPEEILYEAVPDRVEGEVLRFGPGVTASARPVAGPATAAGVWHGTPAAGTDTGAARRPGRGLRRYLLAAGVLAAVLVFLTWQHFGPGVAVRSVEVRAPAAEPGCDGTAEVVGTVRTNGRPGTLRYRWVRSDGSSSGLLRERVAREQEEVRLRLLWTFRGQGEHPARAELRIEAPDPRAASARFTYTCP